MAKASKDLFDDTAMTFGEHLEALRTHVIKGGLGWLVCVIISFMYSDQLLILMRRPLDEAQARLKQSAVDVTPGTFLERFRKEWGIDILLGENPIPVEEKPSGKVDFTIPALNFAQALKTVAPDIVVLPDEQLADKSVTLSLQSNAIALLQQSAKEATGLVTTNMQQGFLTYMKVSMIGGTVLAAPWLFFQAWQFVAAGLYVHERQQVYWFGGMSLLLFFGGILFCFFWVLPFVINFLLGFNQKLGLQPLLRIDEYVSFTVMLPVMFGISFQLPIAMLFLERISIFNVAVYREKRRVAILVIAIISMVLTPADPMSMLLMMLPLLVLYELGIKLCDLRTSRQPSPAGA